MPVIVISGSLDIQQQLKALLGQRQAGGKRDDLVFQLGIEATQGLPGALGNRAAAG